MSIPGLGLCYPPMSSVICRIDHPEKPRSISRCQAPVDVPNFGSATIHRQWFIATIEARFELPDKPNEAAIEPCLLSEDSVHATKVSGKSPISLKSFKTVLMCSSTPKLESFHVGLGEHYASTANIDRRHLLLCRNREHAVRLVQSTC